MWDPGIDPYGVDEAVCDHREIIEKSEICGCIACGGTFKPSEIKKWWNNGTSACCPHCGLTRVVVGSASGLPMTQEYLLTTAHHLCR